MRQSHNEAGVTLVEVLVTLLILALIVVAVPASFRGGTQVWEKGDRHSEVLQNGLIGLEEMTRELKQAGSIIDVSGSSNPEGYVEFKDKDDSTIRYQYDDAVSEHLQRGSPGVLNSLAGPVDSLTFIPYKEDGVTEATTVDEIRSVQIQLVTKDCEGKISPIPLSSRVYLRGQIFPSYPAHQFALFGLTGLALVNGVVVGDTVNPANVGSNGYVSLQNNSSVSGYTVYTDYVEFQNSKVIESGPLIWGYIELPCPTEFSAGITPVNAGNNETIALDPHSVYSEQYSDVVLGNNCTLELTSGNYYFRSITSGNNLNLNIYLALPDAEVGHYINIFVEGRVEIGNALTGSINTTIEGGGPQQVYAETHFESPYIADPGDINPQDERVAWWMGKETTWLGTIYAPFGHVYMTDGTIRGCIYSGGLLVIHNASDIEYVPSDYFLSLGYDCELE